MLMNDFLDNVRTGDLCGEMPNEVEGSKYWELPQPDTTTVTDVAAGGELTVSWDLHYAHQGGFTLELFDANQTLIHTWTNSSIFGDGVTPEDGSPPVSCDVDGTLQATTITLPAEPCNDCILRFQREALEWGLTYKFRSCARITVTPAADACNGCSGRGACGADGACACDASTATGFFYGPHCEFENECEADGDCGANGHCVDVGDTSGPAKQCFCEAGFFGAATMAPSGMQVRSCDTPSALAIDTAALDVFGAEYANTQAAAGGTFAAFWEVKGDVIEVAMRAETTSWLAIGWRSVDPDRAVGDSHTDAEGEPSAEGEAEAPAEATPAAEGEPSDEATPAAAAEGRRLRRRRALLNAPSPEAEATPEAEAEATPAEPAAEGEPAAAEGEGTATTACPVIAAADVQSPTALGAGVAVTEDEAAATAAATEPAAEARRRRLAATAHVPPLEAEAVPAAVRLPAGRRSLSRALTEAESEAEGEGDHEHDDEDKDKEDSLTVLTDGACAGAALTPSGVHPMVNQDVAVAAARVIAGVQAFRVTDMFTPSRAKPLPDHTFCVGGACGTDDILDAVGVEVDGVTYVKFTKPLTSPDPTFADACLSPEQSYALIYAHGQLAPNLTHVPESALEIIPAGARAAETFYHPDELKYHGGGIGTTFAGRGILATAAQLGVASASPAAAAAAPACEPSPADGLACMLEFPTATLHYNPVAPGDVSADLAVSIAAADDWVGLGFPTDGLNMVGAAAVLATSDAADGAAGVFDLNDKDVSAVIEDAAATSVSNVSVTRDAATGTLLRLTRAFDAIFTATGDQNLLLATGAGQTLAYHTGREGVTVSLSA